MSYEELIREAGWQIGEPTEGAHQDGKAHQAKAAQRWCERLQAQAPSDDAARLWGKLAEICEDAAFARTDLRDAEQRIRELRDDVAALEGDR